MLVIGVVSVDCCWGTKLVDTDRLEDVEELPTGDGPGDTEAEIGEAANVCSSSVNCVGNP